MKIAGSSSPASGGEHLISHHWDMTAGREGRVEGWHGAQVGVATIVTSALYEVLSEQDPDCIDVDALINSRPKREFMAKEIRKRHGEYAKEVMSEFDSKNPSDDQLRKSLILLKEDWKGVWQALGEVLRPSERVREILASAGAPVHVRELGLTSEHLRNSFMVAREIRGRFTVLDLAADLGLLEKVRDEVIFRSRCG